MTDGDVHLNKHSNSNHLDMTAWTDVIFTNTYVYFESCSESCTPPMFKVFNQFYLPRVQKIRKFLMFDFWFDARWLVSSDSPLLIKWWSCMQYFILTTLSSLLKPKIYCIVHNNETHSCKKKNKKDSIYSLLRTYVLSV